MAEMAWSDEQRCEYRHRERLRLLYKGEHEVYFTSPDGNEELWEYTPINWLGDLLSPTWKRLLFRKFPELRPKDESQKDAIAAIVDALGLRLLCPTVALVSSWAGCAILKMYWSQLGARPVARIWGNHPGEVAFLEHLPADPSFPVAVQFWYSVCVKDTHYWIQERHALQVRPGEGAPSAVTMTNTAHKSEYGLPTTDVVPLAEVWPDESSRPADTETTEGLTVLPFVAVRNPDRDGDGMGDSDYTQSEIGIQKVENLVQASRYFTIRVGEVPNVSLPADTINPRTGAADIQAAKIRVKYDGETTDTMEIGSWTGNMDNSAEQHRIYREEFRALAGLAPALAGESEGSGGESGFARRLAMVATEAECASRQEAWDAAFRQAVEVGRQLMRVYGKRTDIPDAPIPLSTVWAPIIPEDSSEVSTAVTQEHRDGVRSLRSAVERINPDWDAAQVDAEVTAILDEAAERAALAAPMIPTGGGA